MKYYYQTSNGSVIAITPEVKEEYEKANPGAVILNPPKQVITKENVEELNKKIRTERHAEFERGKDAPTVPKTTHHSRSPIDDSLRAQEERFKITDSYTDEEKRYIAETKKKEFEQNLRYIYELPNGKTVSVHNEVAEEFEKGNPSAKKISGTTESTVEKRMATRYQSKKDAEIYELLSDSEKLITRYKNMSGPSTIFSSAARSLTAGFTGIEHSITSLYLLANDGIEALTGVDIAGDNLEGRIELLNAQMEGMAKGRKGESLFERLSMSALQSLPSSLASMATGSITAGAVGSGATFLKYLNLGKTAQSANNIAEFTRYLPIMLSGVGSSYGEDPTNSNKLYRTLDAFFYGGIEAVTEQYIGQFGGRGKIQEALNQLSGIPDKTLRKQLSKVIFKGTRGQLQKVLDPVWRGILDEGAEEGAGQLMTTAYDVLRGKRKDLEEMDYSDALRTIFEEVAFASASGSLASLFSTPTHLISDISTKDMLKNKFGKDSSTDPTNRKLTPTHSDTQKADITPETITPTSIQAEAVTPSQSKDFVKIKNDMDAIRGSLAKGEPVLQKTLTDISDRIDSITDEPTVKSLKRDFNQIKALYKTNEMQKKVTPVETKKELIPNDVSIKEVKQVKKPDPAQQKKEQKVTPVEIKKREEKVTPSVEPEKVNRIEVRGKKETKDVVRSILTALNTPSTMGQKLHTTKLKKLLKETITKGNEGKQGAVSKDGKYFYSSSVLISTSLIPQGILDKAPTLTINADKLIPTHDMIMKPVTKIIEDSDGSWVRLITDNGDSVKVRKALTDVYKGQLYIAINKDNLMDVRVVGDGLFAIPDNGSLIIDGKEISRQDQFDSIKKKEGIPKKETVQKVEPVKGESGIIDYKKSSETDKSSKDKSTSKVSEEMPSTIKFNGKDFHIDLAGKDVQKKILELSKKYNKTIITSKTKDGGVIIEVVIDEGNGRGYTEQYETIEKTENALAKEVEIEKEQRAEIERKKNIEAEKAKQENIKKEQQEQKIKELEKSSPLIIDKDAISKETPLQQGRIKKTLEIKVKYEGKVVTREELVLDPGFTKKSILTTVPRGDLWNNYWNNLAFKYKVDISREFKKMTESEIAMYKENKAKELAKEQSKIEYYIGTDEKPHRVRIPKTLYDLIIENKDYKQPQAPKTGQTEPESIKPTIDTKTESKAVEKANLEPEKSVTPTKSVKSGKDIFYEFIGQKVKGRKIGVTKFLKNRILIFDNVVTDGGLLVSKDRVTPGVLAKARDVSLAFDSIFGTYDQKSLQKVISITDTERIDTNGNVVTEVQTENGSVLFFNKKFTDLIVGDSFIMPANKGNYGILLSDGLAFNPLRNKDNSIVKGKSVETNTSNTGNELRESNAHDRIAYGSLSGKRKNIQTNIDEINEYISEMGNIDVSMFPVSTFFSNLDESLLLNKFKESNSFNIMGLTVENFTDLFTILHSQRSKYIEKTHIVYVDSNNKVVGNQIFTFGLPRTTALPYDQISIGVKKTGATGFYIAHNHPSGSPYPSNGDIEVTRWIAEKNQYNDIGAEFKGHLILDGTQYTKLTYEFEDRGKYRSLLDSQPTKYKEAVVRTALVDVGEIKDPRFDNETVMDRRGVLQFSNALLKGKGNNAAIVYLTNGNGIISYEFLPEGAFSKDVVDNMVYQKKIAPFGNMVIFGTTSQLNTFFDYNTTNNRIFAEANGVTVIGFDISLKKFSHYKSKDYNGSGSTKVIYSSFDTDHKDMEYETYRLSEPLYQPYNGLEEATYDPEWDERLKTKHKLNKLVEMVGWSRSDLISHLVVQYDVTENADDKIIQKALQLVTQDLEKYIPFTDTESIKLLSRSNINKLMKYWEGKKFNEQQTKELDKISKKLNKEISGIDPSKPIPKSDGKSLKVKLTVGNKFWMNLKDIFYKITQETGDQRPTVLSEELDMGRRKYDIEASVIHELLTNLKQYITSKETDVLISNYIQKIGNYQEMDNPKHKKLKDALGDIMLMVENTKGVIAVSRVYDVVSGAISPNSKKFFTEYQKEQINNAKAYFGDYYSNQAEWERFFSLIEMNMDADYIGVLYEGLEFDFNAFVVGEYLPNFVNLQKLKDELGDDLNPLSIEDANDSSDRENMVNVDFTRVREGAKVEVEQSLKLIGMTLLRANRLKYLDRLARRASQVLRGHLNKSDWKEVNNNLKHLIGQADEQTLTGTAFKTLAGLHYRWKVISKLMLPIKNFFQGFIAMDKVSDFPKVFMSMIKPLQKLRDRYGDDVVRWALDMSEQKSNIASVFQLQKEITEQIEQMSRDEKEQKIREITGLTVHYSMMLDELWMTKALEVYMFTDKLNRLSSLLYNIDLIDNAWEKMQKNNGTVNEFLKDIRFNNVVPALQRQLIEHLQTDGIGHFTKQLAYDRMMNTNFEYNRALGSIYANKPGTMWSNFNQYMVWGRSFMMNFNRKVKSLVRRKEWKELGALLMAAVFAMLYQNEGMSLIMGKFDQMLLNPNTEDSTLKKTGVALFDNPMSYNFSTMLPPGASPYNIKRLMAGDADLSSILGDAGMGATMKEVYEGSDAFIRLLSNGLALMRATVDGDKDKIERKKELSIKYLDELSSMGIDYSPVARFLLRGQNLYRDPSLWKTSVFRAMDISNPNRMYEQEWSSDYAKLVYLIFGQRGDRVESKTKKKSNKFGSNFDSNFKSNFDSKF